MEERNLNLIEEQIPGNRVIIVKASQVLRKLRTFQDRKIFHLKIVSRGRFRRFVYDGCITW